MHDMLLAMKRYVTFLHASPQAKDQLKKLCKAYEEHFTWPPQPGDTRWEGHKRMLTSIGQMPQSTLGMMVWCRTEGKSKDISVTGDHIALAADVLPAVDAVIALLRYLEQDKCVTIGTALPAIARLKEKLGQRLARTGGSGPVADLIMTLQESVEKRLTPNSTLLILSALLDPTVKDTFESDAKKREEHWKLLQTQLDRVPELRKLTSNKSLKETPGNGSSSNNNSNSSAMDGHTCHLLNSARSCLQSHRTARRRGRRQRLMARPRSRLEAPNASGRRPRCKVIVFRDFGAMLLNR